MMQVFNEINARKIGAFEFNVFEGFFNNWLFLFIEILTIIVQIVLVEIGGEAVKTSSLTPQQHLICIAIGVGSIVIGFLLKLLPASCFSIKMDQKPMTKAQSQKSLAKMLRKSSRALGKKVSRIGSEKNLNDKELKQISNIKSLNTFKY
mmetsp:Transcript_33763/g.38892  ORF Transcript_33763/g.38892 Transcript_33763/m.38892 type:complete len:149 (-) Transcript_33763:38-484(-)